MLTVLATNETTAHHQQHKVRLDRTGREFWVEVIGGAIKRIVATDEKAVEVADWQDIQFYMGE